MSLTIFPTATVDTAAIEQQVADAKAAADAAHDAAVAADTKAANARQMVLSRDPRLMNLEDVAAKFATEIARTDQIHADLQAGVDAANARAMVAGPKGDPGKDGINGLPGKDGLPGANGTSIKGDKGDKGDAGPSGTANLAIGAAPVPVVALGGNTIVVVPLARTLATVPANVQVAHPAVLNLATVTLAVTAKTASSVTVKVTSVGVAVAAGTLIVVGY